MTGDIPATLKALPGFESASVTQLPVGTGVRAWRITTPAKSAVIKQDVEPRPEPGPTRREEAALQQRAADQGLAASVLWHSPEGIMTEWLPGKPLDVATLRRPTVLAAVARRLGELHRLPTSGVVYDTGRWAAHYRAILGRQRRLSASLAALAEGIEQNPLPGPRVFSHNDCVPGNLIDGDGLKFIDFEFAGDNSPLFDLATLIVEADLSDDEQGLLVDTYFEQRQVPNAELDQAIRTYRAMTALWQACRSPAVA